MYIRKDIKLVGMEGNHRYFETFVIHGRVTTTYCKNFDVLFAALWTKLSILSQNRGNL
jgi:hypothetical protein